MPKKSKGKSRNRNSEAKKNKQVPLQRRTILDGHCSFLAPANITNSGRADGGFMDRIGITASGLGHLFDPLNPNVMGPVEAYYSNDAHARPRFATLYLELNPPLETVGDETTKESLTEYLMAYLRDSENDYYRRGDYERIETVPAPLVDEDDENAPGDLPGHIIHYAFTVPIAPGPTTPPGLTATTYAAIVNFPERGNVLVKASNLERHKPPLDYGLMLGSLRYIANAPFLGPDPTFSGFQGMNALLSGNVTQAKIQRARTHCLAWTRVQSTTPVPKPSCCLTCGADKKSSGETLSRCSKCHVATYCSTDCQRSDWKRHKRTDCVGPTRLM